MMILKGQWAFVSTQKCATNTMYKVLPGYRLGPLHHMPKKRHAPLHWTIVRNPYDRAVSLYGSTALRPHDKYQVKRQCGNPNAKPSFESFVENCLLIPQQKWKHRRRQTHPYLFKNQVDWIKSGMVDKVVHLENLYQEVLDLTGLDLDLPKLNDSPRASWQEYMTPSVIEMLNIWAGEDFRWGYDKL